MEGPDHFDTHARGEDDPTMKEADIHAASTGIMSGEVGSVANERLDEVSNSEEEREYCGSHPTILTGRYTGLKYVGRLGR